MFISKSFFNLRYRKTKYLLLLISIFGLISFNVFSYQVPDSKEEIIKDSIIFYDFDGANYQASSYNYVSDEDEEGIIYFGNENGLLEFDGTHWELYKTPNFTPVTYLKIIGDRIFTFGTFGSNELGFFQRNQEGEMKYHPLNNRFEDEIELPYIWKIIEHKGDVYFGSDSLLLKWDGEVVKKITSNKKYLTIYKIQDDLIVSLYGKDGGLAKIENDSINLINTDFNFENDYAWEILQLNEKEWIIFTSENGFFKLDAETYKTEPWENDVNQYFLQDSNYLYYVEKYRDSLFLSSTWENGLILFNSNGEIIKKLDKEAGLISKFYNHPTKDRRENIWLTSGNGLQYLQFFNPNDKINFIPEAKVRYVKIGDSTVFIKGAKQKLSLTEKKSNSIDFYFSVPSFLQENLQFSFYLEGFDEGWSEWTKNTRKEYTNLAGGNYKFHLKARYIHNPDLLIEPFEFLIIVPTKWYESYITYVSLALFTGLLIFGFIRYRTHRLSLTNKKLESIVKERTSELQSQKEKLKEANDELKTINNELDNFVYRSSHDLVAPLKSLRGLISVAGMSNNPNEIKEYFKLMNVSINKLEEFIKSIMDFSTNTKKPLEIREIGMDSILDSIVEDLKFYENANKVELKRAYDSDFKSRIQVTNATLFSNKISSIF
jgi:hypothetical protein